VTAQRANKDRNTAAKAAAPQARTDGWQNILTGLGRADRDKRMGATAEWCPMREQDAEELYAADDVSETIIDSVPDDGLREWVTFHFEQEGLAADVDSALDRLGARCLLKEGWKFGRLHGGCPILMVTDDGADLSQPLVLERVRELQNLLVLTRTELSVNGMDIDLDIQSRRFGQPITYRLNPMRGGSAPSQQIIHHSRLLMFYGAKLTPRLYMQNGYWHDSVLNRVQNAIRNYVTAHDAAATVMQEFNQGVFKMKGLAQLLMAGKDKEVLSRLQMIQLARSVCRAVIIDSDEEFQNVGAALQGVGDVLDRIGGRLVAASRMPHTKILGESPSGLGATGDSEEGTWYDHVANRQEEDAREPIRRLVEVLLASKKGPSRGKVPEGWRFTFNPLNQLSESEQIKNRGVQAQTDKAYLEAGVVDPIEIRKSRFGSGKYSAETTVDTSLDQRLAAANAEPEKPAKDKGGAA
jgi:phage-related protein (TIGR01555 family)